MPQWEEDENAAELARGQFAASLLSMLANAVNSKCFNQCIKKPGVKLERADEACLSKCMDTYLESWNTVSHTVNSIQTKLGLQFLNQQQQPSEENLQ